MSRLPIKALPLLNGTPLPAFELVDSEGVTHSPASLRGVRGLVVSFVHGTWCPYCVRQLVRLNQATATLEAAQVGLVCISQDAASAIYAYERSASPALAYRLLGDSQPSVSEQFGCFDPDHKSPYPAVFYADADLIIRYTDVSSDPDCYPNMGRLLEMITQD